MKKGVFGKKIIVDFIGTNSIYIRITYQTAIIHIWSTDNRLWSISRINSMFYSSNYTFTPFSLC